MASLGVRRLSAWATAILVLLALWPAVCMSSEDEPTRCQSAFFLPLPWGENADSWGIVSALAASIASYFLVIAVSRPRKT